MKQLREQTLFSKTKPVYHNDGVVKEKGIYMLLGGQISWAPVEETINGVMIVDEFIQPPDGLGVLKEEVKPVIKNGRIIEVSRGRETSIFKKWLESFNNEKNVLCNPCIMGFPLQR